MAENFKQKFAFFSRYGYRKSSGINMELKIFQGPFFPIIFSLCALRAFLCLQWPQNDSPYFRAQVKPENSQLMPKTVYKKQDFAVFYLFGVSFSRYGLRAYSPFGDLYFEVYASLVKDSLVPMFLKAVLPLVK